MPQGQEWRVAAGQLSTEISGRACADTKAHATRIAARERPNRVISPSRSPGRRVLQDESDGDVHDPLGRLGADPGRVEAPVADRVHGSFVQPLEA